MSSVYDGDATRLAPKARNTRSHSLKPPSQPVIFKRSKRTMSLPSKPVLLPLINVQRHYDNWGDDGQENEDGQRSKEEMAWYTPVLGFSCSLAIYFWACALAYYSRTSWQAITFLESRPGAGDPMNHSFHWICPQQTQRKRSAFWVFVNC